MVLPALTDLENRRSASQAALTGARVDHTAFQFLKHNLQSAR